MKQNLIYKIKIMKNRKIVSWLILVAVTTTSIWAAFAAPSFKSSWSSNNINNMRNNLTQEQKDEMVAIKAILEKQKNQEKLTKEEQTKLDEFKANKLNWKWMWFWMMMGWKMWFWWKFMNKLTQEEKDNLKNMTSDEKRAFFDKKRIEQEEKMIAHNNIIDKLLAWEALTNEEESLRQEMIKERAEMKKLKQQRQLERQAMDLIFIKMKNWEALTSDEQTKLDEFRKTWKWKMNK